MLLPKSKYLINSFLNKKKKKDIQPTFHSSSPSILHLNNEKSGACLGWRVD